MSRNDEEIKKRRAESKEFDQLFSEESRKLKLADQISQAREDAGLSIEDFAKELNLSVSSTVSLESGQMALTDSLLKRISEVLNIKFE